MEVVYRNRDPLDSETEEFLSDVVENLELDTDRVVVYPSNVAGIYVGRENEEYPVIGLKEDREHVIAHELGHDRQAQEEGDVWEADIEPDDSGRLIAGSLGKDSIESLTDEIYAELVSAEYSPDSFERKPIGHAHQHFQEVVGDKNYSREYEPIDWVDSQDDDYFVDPKSSSEIREISNMIWTLLEEDKKYLGEIMYNTWRHKIHKCVVRGKEDVIWNKIGENLEVPYEDHVWHRIPVEYGSEAREVIEDNIEDITADIQTSLGSDLAMKVVKGELDEKDFPDNTPNPSHLSPKIASEERIEGSENDFNHNVGNFVGRFLQEDLEVSHKDLHSTDRKVLEEFAFDALELSLEMGKNSSHYGKEDYREGIRFLAEKHSIV